MISGPMKGASTECVFSLPPDVCTLLGGSSWEVEWRLAAGLIQQEAGPVALPTGLTIGGVLSFA